MHTVAWRVSTEFLSDIQFLVNNVNMRKKISRKMLKQFPPNKFLWILRYNSIKFTSTWCRSVKILQASSNRIKISSSLCASPCIDSSLLICLDLRKSVKTTQQFSCKSPALFDDRNVSTIKQKHLSDLLFAACHFRNAFCAQYGINCNIETILSTPGFCRKKFKKTNDWIRFQIISPRLTFALSKWDGARRI